MRYHIIELWIKLPACDPIYPHLTRFHYLVSIHPSIHWSIYFYFLFFCLPRFVGNSEWHEQQAGRDSEISRHVSRNQTTDIPKVLLPLQRWSAGNTWPVQESSSCEYIFIFNKWPISYWSHCMQQLEEVYYASRWWRPYKNDLHNENDLWFFAGALKGPPVKNAVYLYT